MPRSEKATSEFTDDEEQSTSSRGGLKGRRSRADVTRSRVSHVQIGTDEDEDKVVVRNQGVSPHPRRSIADLRKLSQASSSKTTSIEEKLRRRSQAWADVLEDEHMEVGGDEDTKREIEIDDTDDNQDASTEIHPSILSKTYKDITKHVYIRDELTGEDIYWGREFGGEENDYEYDGEDSYNRRARGTSFMGPTPSSALIRRGASFAASSAAFRELLHARVSDVYRKLEIKTFGQLLEARALRPKRLDAYCLGRGLMEKPVEVIFPTLPIKPKMREETIEDVGTFFRRIQEIEEENVNNWQIVCVFTGSVVRSKKTWNEDCNMIEAALNIIKSVLGPPGYLLWVRTGFHKEWKDPNNPFKTDKRLVIRWLPTIKVWNSEKRAAGNRLFFLDHITVLLED